MRGALLEPTAVSQRQLVPRWGASAATWFAATSSMLLLNVIAWLETSPWGWRWTLAVDRLINFLSVLVLGAGCALLLPTWGRAVARGAPVATVLGLVLMLGYAMVATLAGLLSIAVSLQGGAVGQQTLIAGCALVAALAATMTAWWMVLALMERGRELALAESQTGAMRLVDCFAWSAAWYALLRVVALWGSEAVGGMPDNDLPAWCRELVGFVQGAWPGIAGPFVAGAVAVACWLWTRRDGGRRRVLRVTGCLSALLWIALMGPAAGVYVWQLLRVRGH